MNGQNRKTLALVLLLFLSAVAPAIGEPCPSCSGEPVLANAATLLSALGYPATNYQVLFMWSERVQDGSDKYVTGFRLQPLQGGEPFDLYTDGANALLTQEQLAALGIAEKQWDAPVVEAPASAAAASGKSLREQAVAVGPDAGLGVSAGVDLPPIDTEALLQEDASRTANGEKGPARIGVVQDLEPPIVVDGTSANEGSWQAVPSGGWLWSVALYVPDSVGVRVHFAAIELPSGAQVLIYDAADASATRGPYASPGKGAQELWSGTCFAETVVVECFVPQSETVADVHLRIDQVIHQYLQLGDTAAAKAFTPNPAGWCENDVTCHSNWASPAAGVVLFSWPEGQVEYCCSGSAIAMLLNNVSSSATPYLLTANHCISTSKTAAQTEFYWFYQTSTCNGARPSISTMPTTSGATLIATTTESAGTDFCLLGLNETPPNGVAFLGWSSATAATGTSLAGIHHPEGNYKRISFGAITSNGTLLKPAERFYQVRWSSGVTESGSSGSPILDVASQRILGQLWGGNSACNYQNGDDYYGRFDKTYPVIQSYLNQKEGILGVSNLAPSSWNIVGGLDTVAGSVDVTLSSRINTNTGQMLVIGLRDDSGAWVASTTPVVLFSGTPGSSGTAYVNESYVMNTVAVASQQTWRVWLHDALTGNQSAAISEFENATPTANGFHDYALGVVAIAPQSRPSANFWGTPLSGPAPLTVQFADTSQVGSAPITQWAWDFGDGDTSSGRNPSHTYSDPTPRTYSVSLTVTNSYGSDSVTKQNCISVTSASGGEGEGEGEGEAVLAAPNVVGMTPAAAGSLLAAEGLALGTQTEAYSATVLSGEVINQNPLAGTSVAAGTSVSLVISKGPAPIIVPSLVGRAQAGALTALAAAGLSVGSISPEYSTTTPSGAIISQNPEAGTKAARGASVDLVVSKGVKPTGGCFAPSSNYAAGDALMLAVFVCLAWMLKSVGSASLHPPRSIRRSGNR